MSLEKLQSAFKCLNRCEVWAIQLLRIKTSKTKGTEYAAFSINLSPQGKLNQFVEEISDHYSKVDKCELNSSLRVQEYDGTMDGNTVYTLKTRDPLIAEEYSAFVTALANAEQEADPLSQRLQAYVIQGRVIIDTEEISVKLISMQNPVTTLKHKFLHEKNAFKEIETKVLSLRPAIDVMILNDKIYFITMSGERLFNMERAYRTVCDSKVTMLEQSGILSDSNVFGNVARTGHHPRMFVSFNEGRFRRLTDESARRQYAELFEIPLKEGVFDMSIDGAADKLVRLLCNRGMVDPFEEQPVEVSSARKWK